MEFKELAVLIGTGAIAGILAGAIMKTGRFGIIGTIVVGVVGGFVGGWLLGLDELDFSFGKEWLDSVAVATLGAVVLILLVGLVKRKLK